MDDVLAPDGSGNAVEEGDGGQEDPDLVPYGVEDLPLVLREPAPMFGCVPVLLAVVPVLLVFVWTVGAALGVIAVGGLVVTLVSRTRFRYIDVDHDRLRLATGIRTVTTSWTSVRDVTTLVGGVVVHLRGRRRPVRVLVPLGANGVRTPEMAERVAALLREVREGHPDLPEDQAARPLVVPGPVWFFIVLYVAEVSFVVWRVWA